MTWHNLEFMCMALLTGEHKSSCPEVGGFEYDGSVTFPEDADWPMDLHKKGLRMSATKYCQPDAEYVWVGPAK